MWSILRRSLLISGLEPALKIKTDLEYYNTNWQNHCLNYYLSPCVFDREVSHESAPQVNDRCDTE